MKDMIRTLHPGKKQGVNINKEKYEMIRKAILSTLRTEKEMTFMKLSRAVEKEVNGKQDLNIIADRTAAILKHLDDMPKPKPSGMDIPAGKPMMH